MTSGGPSRFDEADEDLGLTRLGDSLSGMLRRRGLGRSLELAEVLTAWERVAGAEMAKRVRPVTLVRDELVCEVDDPAWATQAKLLSGELLVRLEAEIGSSAPARMSVRVRSKRYR